jgi:hypothetical protein
VRRTEPRYFFAVVAVARAACTSARALRPRPLSPRAFAHRASLRTLARKGRISQD